MSEIEFDLTGESALQASQGAIDYVMTGEDTTGVLNKIKGPVFFAIVQKLRENDEVLQSPEVQGDPHRQVQYDILDRLMDVAQAHDMHYFPFAHGDEARYKTEYDAQLHGIRTSSSQVTR